MKRRERSGVRWKLRRCSESMCLSHLHPLGSMFFNLISQPGLCVARLSVALFQGQLLLQRSEQFLHFCLYSLTAWPQTHIPHARPHNSQKLPVEACQAGDVGG